MNWSADTPGTRKEVADDTRVNRGKLKETIHAVFRTLRRELVPHLFFGVLGLIALGTLGFFLSETHIQPWVTRLGRAAWWALVTLTTVGYGDVVPRTLGGRVVGVCLMLGGFLMLSLLTATIASVFVGRKFRQERGLEAVKAERHVLVLGWNRDGLPFLDQLMRRLPANVPVVLVNQLPTEKMENIKAKYSDRDFYYVWGDFSREDILLKANVRRASQAILLAGRQEGETAAQADQRILLTALTLKSINPKLKILAELRLPENRPYLERAGVNEILVRGQYDSSLLAGAVAAPGLFHLLTRLLTMEGTDLWAVEVPIDDFIRRKFEETGMTHLFGRAKVEVQINPPDDQLLEPRQQAVVIAAARPLL